MKITIDFETSSHADLKAVGAWMYSRHSSTEVMCVGWSSGAASGQWRGGDPLPLDLFAEIAVMADIVEAHNSFFEYCIWLNVCVKKYGWPAVPDDMWRCSAAKAAACSIPRGLGDAGRALGLSVVKDEGEGKWEMMKLTKGKRGDWDKMLAYNRGDVAAEEALSRALPDLSSRELEVWRASERMNRRGFMVDVAGCQNAVRLAGAYAQRLTAEFHDITSLDTAGQRAKFIVWLNGVGLEVADTQAKTLDDLLADESKLPAGTDIRRAVEIVRALGRSSIKKYRTALEQADADGRVRGTVMYHGAGTGRWTGRGVQPHNYPRQCPPDMERAWRDIHELDIDVIDMIHGDPIKFLSQALRGSIVAPPGRRLIVGDYAQIEARKVFWLAGDRGALDVFRDRERDMYCEMAGMIFNRKITKRDENERFLGKQATLALGFGAGFVKYLIHCRNLGAPRFEWRQVCELVPANHRTELYNWIVNDGWEMVKRYIEKPTLDDARELVLTKYIVDRFRGRYKDTVVALWTKLETAFRQAMARPGEWIGAPVAYRLDGKFMCCRLPSGRIIRYYDPRSDGRELTAMASDSGKWVRRKLYGGLLTENVVQASARDVMADAWLRLERMPAYEHLVLTVHDELGAEVADGVGSVEEFEEVMSKTPAWCAGLPIRVEVFEAKRYRK